MKPLILATLSENKLKHWHDSLAKNNLTCKEILDEKEFLDMLNLKKEYLIILDASFPISINTILKKNPNTKILFMDDIPSLKKGLKALSLGVKGYANSRLASIHLLQAIDIINSGNIWLYPEFIHQMIKDYSSSHNKSNISKITEKLTNKEKNIAQLVAKGYSNKEIASSCNITESTVKVHLKSIFSKLKVTDRLSLALLLKS